MDLFAITLASLALFVSLLTLGILTVKVQRAGDEDEPVVEQTEVSQSPDTTDRPDSIFEIRFVSDDERTVWQVWYGDESDEPMTAGVAPTTGEALRVVLHILTNSWTRGNSKVVLNVEDLMDALEM